MSTIENVWTFMAKWVMIFSKLMPATIKAANADR